MKRKSVKIVTFGFLIWFVSIIVVVLFLFVGKTFLAVFVEQAVSFTITLSAVISSILYLKK
jgi:hypothetical protein